MDTVASIPVSALRSRIGTPRALAAHGLRARYLEGGIEDRKAAGAPTVRKLAGVGQGTGVQYTHRGAAHAWSHPS
jgi:hypothetical protein